MSLTFFLFVSSTAFSKPCFDAGCEIGTTQEANYCELKKGQSREEIPEKVRRIFECQKNEVCEGTTWAKTEKTVACE